MAFKPLTDEQMREAVEALATHFGNQTQAAESLGLSRSALWSRLRAAERNGIRAIPVPAAEPLPPRDIPIDDLVAHREQAFSIRHAHNQAKVWRKFRVPSSGPYALMFFGDPHLDDDGCNLPLFKAHAKLAAETDHLYAVNIGDTTNDWTGRLARLWANQDASAETAKRLVKHYMVDSGVPWFLWLHGNHDMWDGPVGRDFFEGVKPTFVEMQDWQAKITLVSPNGHELRLWAAHNFKGNSIWNNMHGLERAAQMQDWAHLYVAGHHHDCGIRQGENAHRRFVYNLMRVRGFKFDDEYSATHGFGEHQHGASGVAVVDPSGDKLNAVTCFLDPFEAVEFLAWKRAKEAA